MYRWMVLPKCATVSLVGPHFREAPVADWPLRFVTTASARLEGPVPCRVPGWVTLRPRLACARRLRLAAMALCRGLQCCTAHSAPRAGPLPSPPSLGRAMAGTEFECMAAAAAAAAAAAEAGPSGRPPSLADPPQPPATAALRLTSPREETAAHPTAEDQFGAAVRPGTSAISNLAHCRARLSAGDISPLC